MIAQGDITPVIDYLFYLKYSKYNFKTTYVKDIRL